MPERHLIARYYEIALKGGNRARFVQELSNNLTRMLRGTGVLHAQRDQGRVILLLRDDADRAEIRNRVRRVFGIANFLLCRRTERTMEAITAAVLEELNGRRFASFAVRTKRADKTFPFSSPDIARQVGRAVQERTGSRVDLEHPETEIHVEVVTRNAFVSWEKIEGAKGLPLGSSGKVVALLSGGIDSPVAAHRIMQRGCAAEFVHFHGAPYQSRASQDKVLELMEVLNRWQPDARLHLVPFGAVQQEIVRQAPRLFRVILYRRMMLRIAETIARQSGAAALVTGESLGQVASQTLLNLAATEEAATLPVLRPLIAMDKQEITEQAHRLGTFTISIQPDEDCCQLFVPRHPATHTNVAEAREAEAPLDIPALVDSALAQSEVVDFEFPRPAREAAPAVPAEKQL